MQFSRISAEVHEVGGEGGLGSAGPAVRVVRVVLRGRARMGDNENSVTSLATELRREGWGDGGREREGDRGSATRLGKQTLVSRGKTFGGGAGREGRGGRGGTCCYNMHILRAPLLSTVTS